ncbi:hypothetical protein HDU76_004007 [Blyttiomyces sp. JEL0837]|nr:hypothetical protein HDU76_004007 [Blyttiomyces sp. JEL0837]
MKRGIKAALVGSGLVPYIIKFLPPCQDIFTVLPLVSKRFNEAVKLTPVDISCTLTVAPPSDDSDKQLFWLININKPSFKTVRVQRKVHGDVICKFEDSLSVADCQTSVSLKAICHHNSNKIIELLKEFVKMSVFVDSRPQSYVHIHFERFDTSDVSFNSLEEAQKVGEFTKLVNAPILDLRWNVDFLQYFRGPLKHLVIHGTSNRDNIQDLTPFKVFSDSLQQLEFTSDTHVVSLEGLEQLVNLQSLNIASIGQNVSRVSPSSDTSKLEKLSNLTITGGVRTNLFLSLTSKLPALESFGMLLSSDPNYIFSQIRQGVSTNANLRNLKCLHIKPSHMDTFALTTYAHIFAVYLTSVEEAINSGVLTEEIMDAFSRRVDGDLKRPTQVLRQVIDPNQTLNVVKLRVNEKTKELKRKLRFGDYYILQAIGFSCQQLAAREYVSGATSMLPHDPNKCDPYNKVELGDDQDGILTVVDEKGVLVAMVVPIYSSDEVESIDQAFSDLYDDMMRSSSKGESSKKAVVGFTDADGSKPLFDGGQTKKRLHESIIGERPKVQSRDLLMGYAEGQGCTEFKIPKSELGSSGKRHELIKNYIYATNDIARQVSALLEIATMDQAIRYLSLAISTPDHFRCAHGLFTNRMLIRTVKESPSTITFDHLENTKATKKGRTAEKTMKRKFAGEVSYDWIWSETANANGQHMVMDGWGMPKKCGTLEKGIGTLGVTICLFRYV